jgi:hypothetical protein
VDPFSLLLLAQSAVSFIKEGCDMLREGQVAVDEFKEQAESLVGQAQEVYDTVSGLWGTLASLWAKLVGAQPVESKSAPVVEQPIKPQETAPVQTRKRVEKAPDPELLQMRVVHEVSQKLGEFFDIQQKVANHYRDLELESLHVYDPDQNNAKKAIERVEVELQMEYLGVQIREAMVYAPKELKNLYSRFLAMYGKIEEEQEFARQEQIRNARNKRWRLEARRNFRIEMAMWALGMGVVWLVVAGMMARVATLSGYSLEWFSLDAFVSFVCQLRRCS